MIGGGKVSLLEVKDVNMNYHTIDGTTEAIKNISFKVEKEDFVSIIGPSGCGKSTLLNIISGILIPSSGEVKFSDSSIKIIQIKWDICFKRIIYFLGYQLEKMYCQDLRLKRYIQKKT